MKANYSTKNVKPWESEFLNFFVVETMYIIKWTGYIDMTFLQ